MSSPSIANTDKRDVLRKISDAVGGTTALAALLDTHRVVVERWENGRRPLPQDRRKQIKQVIANQIAVLRELKRAL